MLKTLIYLFPDMVIFSSELPPHIPAQVTQEVLWFSKLQCTMKCLHLITKSCCDVVYHHIFSTAKHSGLPTTKHVLFDQLYYERISPLKTYLSQYLCDCPDQMITRMKHPADYIEYSVNLFTLQQLENITKEKPTGTQGRDTLLRH